MRERSFIGSRSGGAARPSPWGDAGALLLALGGLVSTAVCLEAGSFVHDAGTYFTTVGDVDGDGREDVVLVDRASGACRIGFGDGAGGFAFADPVASGVPGATGLAVGRLLGEARDALAVSGFEANRVQVVSPVDPVFTEARAVEGAVPVPGPVAALDVPGSGTDGLDDLVVHSSGRAEAVVLKNVEGTLGEIWSFAPGDGPRGFNPVPLAPGGAQHLGFFSGGAGGFAYSIAKAVTSAVVPEFRSTSLAGTAQAIWVRAAGAATHDFLFFVPGGTEVVVQRVAPGEDAFEAPELHDLGSGIARMFRLPDPGGDRVLVHFADGSAEVFSFDPAAGFGSLGTVGEGGGAGPPTGAVPLSDGRFVAVYGDPASGLGAGAFQVFEWDGSTYVPTAPASELPPLFADGFAGNLFFFDGVPLLDEGPGLLGQRRAADWTVEAISGGGAALTVVGQSFRDPASGLGGSEMIGVGAPAPGTVGILVNQVRRDVSIAAVSRRGAVLGERVAGLRISPPQGAFDHAIEVSITPTEAGDRVFARRDGAGPFVESTGRFPLFVDTVIEAYAESPDGLHRSAVQRVAYAFDRAPADQDADADGVPDFVEVARNLSPVGGGDSDGDGFGDLEELLSGRDPGDPGDHPDPEADGRRATAARLRLLLTPRPWNGAGGFPGFARRGVNVRGWTVEGGLLGAGTTELDGGPASTSVALELEPVDVRRRVVAAATEPHFKILSTPSDQVLGRELVGLLAVPEPPGVEVAFDFDAGADPMDEAAEWIAAAVAAYDAAEPPVLARELGVVDVLVLALVEAKLRLVLASRDPLPEGRLVSLTPFRSGEFDESRFRHLAPGDLEAVAGMSPEGLSAGWRAARVEVLLEAGAQWVASAAGLPLVALVEDFYQVSSAHNEDVPAGLPLPLDALREFLQLRSFPAEYAPFSELKTIERAAAESARDALLGEVSGRPVVTLEVEVPEAGVGSEAGGPTLVTVVGGGVVSLVDRRGAPFEFPEAFGILPGSRLAVAGFDDLTEEGGGRTVEVVEARVLFLAQPSPGDLDGNLLGDSWELFFFGRTGLDPHSSPDGSGFSLLHQFLSGTDPTDGASVPAGEPVAFGFDELELELGPDGDAVFSWEWPAAFVDDFEFGVRVSAGLGGAFESVETILDVLPGDPAFEDEFAAVIDLGAGADGPGRLFFQAFVRLR